MPEWDRIDSFQRAVTFDDVLGALAHIQRRKLLVSLLHHNPQADEPVIVNDADAEDEQFARLLEMRHMHLPKLETYGFIEWSQETGKVSKGPNFEEIRPVLELLESHADELPPDWR